MRWGWLVRGCAVRIVGKKVDWDEVARCPVGGEVAPSPGSGEGGVVGKKVVLMLLVEGGRSARVLFFSGLVYSLQKNSFKN